MSECYAGILPSQMSLFSNLCYSNILGIVNSPGFICRDCIDDNHVLIYVSQGRFVCKQGDFFRVLSEGEYVLLDKKILHTYYFEKETETEIYWMHLNGFLVNSLIMQINELVPLPILDRNGRVFSLLKRSISSFREKRDDPFIHSETILSILSSVLEDAYRQNQNINRSANEVAFRLRFDRIVSSVSLERITLDFLCEQMHLNKYYFSHQFKKFYGLPPMNYVTRLKLNKSEQFLRYSDLKISTVARECGFSSPSHFSVAFRREYGITPEEYRKQSK